MNTKRGMTYLGVTAGVIALLVISAQIMLPGLHVLSQVLLVVLLVGLPLFFEEKWSTLFSAPDPSVQVTPRRHHPFLLGVFSILLGLLFAGLSNGPALKTAELPQGVSVSAANLPAGVSANFGTQKRINVIVRAPSSTWGKLTSEDFSATVDVKGLSEGTHDLQVSLSTRLPDVQIIRSKPDHVAVSLEPVIRKTVAVVARFEGKAANDLVPGEPTFNPDKVEVTGAKSIIEDITQAVVQVKLEGATQTLEQKLQAVALTPNGSVIEDVSFLPAEVETRVSLVKAGKQKTVGVKPRVTGQPATGYWVENIQVTPSTITITGEVDLLEKITSIDTDQISVSGLSVDTDTTATLAFPVGIVSTEGLAKVTVKIKISESSTVKQIQPTISYVGLDPSLKVTSINPTSVNSIVAGTQILLASITSGDALLKLDLSAYKSAGTYSVNIKATDFELKNGVSIVSFLPSAISVTLELK